jgi:hypothetical protein
MGGRFHPTNRRLEAQERIAHAVVSLATNWERDQAAQLGAVSLAEREGVSRGVN